MLPWIVRALFVVIATNAEESAPTASHNVQNTSGYGSIAGFLLDTWTFIEMAVYDTESLPWTQSDRFMSSSGSGESPTSVTTELPPTASPQPGPMCYGKPFGRGDYFPLKNNICSEKYTYDNGRPGLNFDCVEMYYDHNDREIMNLCRFGCMEGRCITRISVTAPQNGLTIRPWESVHLSCASDVKVDKGSCVFMKRIEYGHIVDAALYDFYDPTRTYEEGRVQHWDDCDGEGGHYCCGIHITEWLPYYGHQWSCSFRSEAKAGKQLRALFAFEVKTEGDACINFLGRVGGDSSPAVRYGNMWYGVIKGNECNDRLSVPYEPIANKCGRVQPTNSYYREHCQYGCSQGACIPPWEKSMNARASQKTIGAELGGIAMLECRGDWTMTGCYFIKVNMMVSGEDREIKVDHTMESTYEKYRHVQHTTTQRIDDDFYCSMLIVGVEEEDFGEWRCFLEGSPVVITDGEKPPGQEDEEFPLTFSISDADVIMLEHRFIQI